MQGATQPPTTASGCDPRCPAGASTARSGGPPESTTTKDHVLTPAAGWLTRCTQNMPPQRSGRWLGSLARAGKLAARAGLSGPPWARPNQRLQEPAKERARARGFPSAGRTKSCRQRGWPAQQHCCCIGRRLRYGIPAALGQLRHQACCARPAMSSGLLRWTRCARHAGRAVLGTLCVLCCA